MRIKPKSSIAIDEISSQKFPDINIITANEFGKLLDDPEVITFSALVTSNLASSEEVIDIMDLEALEDSVPEEISRMRSEFSSVFSTEEFPKLPSYRPGFDMKIKLIDGEVPPYGPIYSLSKEEEDALREYLQAALAAGIISPSKSPAGSPVMFVKKKDGSLRLCVDYRGLNRVTVSDRTALPIIQDMIRRTVGCKFFSKIDLKSAFNLIRIANGSEYLTAFRTKYGHFEYNVMPFGLKNAPGIFQAFINHVFGDLIDIGLLGYIDDLLIYSKSHEEHFSMLREVFTRLKENGLKANPKKCSFYQSKIQFLGHEISSEGVSMDPAKLESILEWAQPCSGKELQSFLGLANYYRDFIPKFSYLTAPLSRLLRKDQPWNFDSDCVRSFKALKEAFAKNVVLLQPDREEAFYLECDASDYALGAVLEQRDERTGRMRPVAFYSRKFTAPELNYEIHDKELLAIVDSLKQWRYLLVGTHIPVTVYTDHKNLLYFRDAKVLNRRQARWSQFLADFNFVITYRKGSEQRVSDPLSRQASLTLNEHERYINHQILLPSNRFQSISTLELCALELGEQEDNSEFEEDENTSNSDSDEDPSDEVMEQHWEAGEIRESPDPFWFQIFLSYFVSGYLPLVVAPAILTQVSKNVKYFVMRNDRLHRRITLNSIVSYVPYVQVVFRKEIMQRYHITLGHMSANSLFPLLYAKYYWPTMLNDCKAYIRSCEICELGAVPKSVEKRQLHPHEPVGLPFVK